MFARATSSSSMRTFATTAIPIANRAEAYAVSIVDGFIFGAPAPETRNSRPVEPTDCETKRCRA
jgi:hypothetical protein